MIIGLDHRVSAMFMLTVVLPSWLWAFASTLVMDAGTLHRECSCSYSLYPSSHLRFSRFLSQARSSRRQRQYRLRRLPVEEQWQSQERIVVGAADLSAEFPQGDEEPPEINEIFPRIREGNPYRWFLKLVWAFDLLVTEDFSSRKYFWPCSMVRTPHLFIKGEGNLHFLAKHLCCIL